jgi:CheY-like chemotaxis protein
LTFVKTSWCFTTASKPVKHLKPILESPEVLPDVILLDLNMPVMDGWQFLDEFIKFKVSKKITVYIVSSSIDVADHAKAATYKAISNFYIKPISRDDLAQMMVEISAA